MITNNVSVRRSMRVQRLWKRFSLILYTGQLNAKLIGFFCSQVLSALDILQPPSLDFFQEMYPFQCSNGKHKLCRKRSYARVVLTVNVGSALTLHVSPPRLHFYLESSELLKRPTNGPVFYILSPLQRY